MKLSLLLQKTSLYLPLFVLTSALGNDIRCGAESLPLPPPCLLESHHGLGNCPLQVLKQYTKNQLDTWIEEKNRQHYRVTTIAMHQ